MERREKKGKREREREGGGRKEEERKEGEREGRKEEERKEGEREMDGNRYKYINNSSHFTSIICYRRNWKNRYFALRGKTLFYYSESDLATAKPNGAIDLKDVT